MPAVAPYIPAKDSLFQNWFANFNTLVTAAPATYGLTAGDAAAIAAAYATWNTDYLLVTSPSTKTPTTVQNKNAAKVNALAIVRPYAVTVSLNAGVSSANKIALGVNPRTSVPLPITAPTTAPTLTAQSTSPAGTIIRYRDSTSSPSVKSKPYGVIAMQLYAEASTTPITDPTTINYIGNYTKSPLTLVLGSAAAGKTVYMASRWVTRKGLVGPWSAIISYVVAG